MYIDAKQIDGRIYVSERNKDGVRKVTNHLPPYVFYYEDSAGSHTSIYGDKLKRERYHNRKEFYKNLAKRRESGYPIFESDIKPALRFLEENYPTNDTPPLRLSILDFEADKDPERGWSRVSNPYAEITAVTVFNKWEDAYYTLVVPPPGMSYDEARELLDTESDDGFGSLTEEGGYFICSDEAELLLTFIGLIQDADVITGWNSTFFDIPYFVQRLRIVLGGEDIDELNLEDGSEQYPYNPSEESISYLLKLGMFPAIPDFKMVAPYGTPEKVYVLSGRVHLDYLELYRKFTFEELHSYALDFILKKVVNQSKVEYEGPLEQLYRQDFRRFTAYNRQDVAGLAALDDKTKMIDLANQMAHMASVPLEKVLGSVVIIEQAILKRLHQKGLICFDKEEKTDDIPVPGAFVFEPDAGMYDWVCNFDINSLYPSIIRCINISPEVLVGQFDLSGTEEKYERWYDHYGGNKPGASAQVRAKAASKAWTHFTGVLEYHDLIDGNDNMLTLCIDGTGEEISAPAKEWKEILRENNWGVSGNGTVFRLDKEGIVSECLTTWYSDRKVYQGKKKDAIKNQDGINDPEILEKLKNEESLNDMLQQVMKIFLNSTYGAYLNKFFRFYDPRLGRSVTLTGRPITKHMAKEASRRTTGNYDFDKRVIIYGDTDSAYCTLNWYMKENGITPNVEDAIRIADELGEKINDSFPEFMNENFLVGKKRGGIIQAGREVVAIRGLFKAQKKRYALHVVDEEGKTVDKLKITGMETRRSDTPKFIQDFLEHVLKMAVQENKSYSEIRDYVDEFRKKFRGMDSWKRGSPGRVSNLMTASRKLEMYDEALSEGYIDASKPRIHWTVVAANNTNKLMEMNNEHRWDVIHDGDKTETLNLLDNPYDMKTVCIKVGENYVPEWFKHLPFDNQKHEDKLVDKKLFNVIGSILDWSFVPKTNTSDEISKTVDFYG